MESLLGFYLYPLFLILCQLCWYLTTRLWALFLVLESFSGCTVILLSPPNLPDYHPFDFRLHHFGVPSRNLSKFRIIEVLPLFPYMRICIVLQF